MLNLTIYCTKVFQCVSILPISKNHKNKNKTWINEEWFLIRLKGPYLLMGACHYKRGHHTAPFNTTFHSRDKLHMGILSIIKKMMILRAQKALRFNDRRGLGLGAKRAHIDPRSCVWWGISSVYWQHWANSLSQWMLAETGTESRSLSILIALFK